MTSAAELYDEVLHSFLYKMLSEDELSNTVVVVRGDHGLQGGPLTADYAIQIEALRPWTEIIVPSSLAGLSLPNLTGNQQRLSTGADLYWSLVDTMVFGSKSRLVPERQSWMYNLFKEEVPSDRTCADAMVPTDYCLFESQRTRTGPNLGTCNLAETTQDFFCPGLSSRFRNRLGSSAEEAFLAAGLLCLPPKEIEKRPVSAKLESLWGSIDELVKRYPNAKVSGGIFLYDLQSAMLSSVVKELATQVYEKEGRSLNVCETGFGAGHSAALFLEASPHVTVHSFDMFDRPYQDQIIEEILNSGKTRRLRIHQGNSCITVPMWLKERLVKSVSKHLLKCDFLHGSSLCPSDNVDLVENSPCGVIITSTAMNSLDDNAVYFGPDGQWTDLQKRDCIRDISCYSEEEKELSRGYVFNRDGSSIVHKFCIAVTTGKCSKERAASSSPTCDNTIAKIVSKMGLNERCPSFRFSAFHST